MRDTCAYLTGLLGGGHVSVPVREVLELLDPGRGWNTPDPRADPVTGCLPVTPLDPRD